MRLEQACMQASWGGVRHTARLSWALQGSVHVRLRVSVLICSAVSALWLDYSYRLLCPWISQVRTLEWVAIPSSRGSSLGIKSTALAPPPLVVSSLSTAPYRKHILWLYKWKVESGDWGEGNDAEYWVMQAGRRRAAPHPILSRIVMLVQIAHLQEQRSCPELHLGPPAPLVSQTFHFPAPSECIYQICDVISQLPLWKSCLLN